MSFVHSSYAYSSEVHEARAAQTAATLTAAVQKAQKDSLPIVCASTYGVSALMLVNIKQELGCKSQLIVVRHHPHLKADRSGVVQLMPAETEEALLAAGVKIVTGIHLFDGMSRASLMKYKGAETGIVVSDTLRLFGPGMKVAVECAIMAMEAGHLEYPQKVVSVGGRGAGSDTAIVLTPVPSSSFFDLRILEILCMQGEQS